MSLLSQPAIALLERLPSTWTELDALELAVGDRALLELRREGLAETDVWPPPDPRRRYYRSAGRAIDDEVKRVSRVRRTGRGAFRLQRLREARRC